MGKKKSDSDRLLEFALGATEPVLDTAISLLVAVRRNRFPAVVQKLPKRAPRKPRASKAAFVQPTDDAEKAAVASGD